MKKDPKIFLQHIRESIEEIERYIENSSEKDFMGDVKTQDAVMRRIEIIGEAVKNLPVEFRKKHPGIEWRETRAQPPKLTPTYFGVDIDLVWDVVKKDIPKPKKQISKLLTEFKENAHSGDHAPFNHRMFLS